MKSLVVLLSTSDNARKAVMAGNPDFRQMAAGHPEVILDDADIAQLRGCLDGINSIWDYYLCVGHTIDTYADWHD